MCVHVVGNVHVTWMNPNNEFDTQKSSFLNMEQRNIYIGAPLVLIIRVIPRIYPSYKLLNFLL